jgi:hypothetical protein
MHGVEAITAVYGGKQLTADQKAEVAKLAARDRDVRAHEVAHLAAAGSMASGVEYTYELGPDGRLYAVSGEVKVTIPIGLTPEQKLVEARRLHAAAEAPNDPSGQDITAVAQASKMETDALQEIDKEHAKSPHPPPPGAESHTPYRELDRTA